MQTPLIARLEHEKHARQMIYDFQDKKKNKTNKEKAFLDGYKSGIDMAIVFTKQDESNTKLINLLFFFMEEFEHNNTIDCLSPQQKQKHDQAVKLLLQIKQ